MNWLRGVVDELRLPFRAFLVAAGGIALASFWFQGKPGLALLILAFLVGMGEVIAFTGERLLPNKPEKALRWLEWSVLGPAGLSAAAAALTVVLGVELSASEAAETKALAAALGIGITAFITTGFLSWTGDASDSKVAGHIRDAFYRHYKREGDPGADAARVVAFERYSAGERWVYSNAFRCVEGWGRKARLQRARGIAEEMEKKRNAPNNP
jgi:hypothetical protein